jgi:two-component system, chemotaxis family, CheB/CheR fusion protein
VQIFASDLSGASIAKARAGLYMENLVADLSPERLQRFFAKTDGGYQVAKGIRDLCIFAPHNLVTDPPFSQLDLVSCCNVFIYLRPEFQRRVMELFYYALKPRGFLKIGRSETIGGFDESFTAVDKTSKIYAKKLGPARAPLTFGRAAHYPFGGTPLAGAQRSAAVIVQDLRGKVDRLLLERYAPVGVLVNEDMDIVEFRGRTVPYLEPAPGDASLNLLKMARGGLALDIRAACREARKQNAPVRREGLQIAREGRLSTFNLEVIPIASAPARGQQFLVLFEDRAQTSGIDQTKSDEKATTRPARRIAERGIGDARGRRQLKPIHEHA